MARATESSEDPRLDLSKDTRSLARLAEDGSTDEECASILGVSVQDLQPYSAVLLKARAELNLRIRRAVLSAGDKGSPEAQAWLSAKYLDKRRT